jgi:hypothetical protein
MDYDVKKLIYRSVYINMLAYYFFGFTMYLIISMSLNKTKNTSQVIKTISKSLKIILMRFTFLHVFFQI